MSFQVGGACYATPVDAGIAACAQYAPVSTLVQDGAVIRTVSCSSADPSTGALNLNVSSTTVNVGQTTSATIQQLLSFPECQQQNYVEAGQLIFTSLLGLWVVFYGGKKIIEVINWGRSDST